MISRDIAPIVRDPRNTPYLFAGPDPYWDTERRIHAMMDEMRHRFEEFEKSAGGIFPGARTEVSEKDGRIVVRAELPGFDEDDIDVSIARGLLTISAERLSDAEEQEGWQGEQHAVFQHSLLLPEDIDTDEVEAVFKSGVLTVTIASRPDPAPGVKRIPVQRAQSKRALAQRYAVDLSKYREKLAELRQEAAQLGDDVASGLKRRLGDMEGLGDRFAERLGEFEKASGGAVAGIRKRLESAWHDMSQGLSRLSERVRRKKQSS